MESPFFHLLSTNYVPSKEEMSQINDLLIDPVNQLDLLDAEISRLQEIIEVLTSKRTQLDDGILKHRALLTPMRRIPEELLQEIFIHCLPTHHNAVMSAKHAPLLLGRVCSQWRRVSVSTPRLWSSIHIAITDEPRPCGGWSARRASKVEGEHIHINAVQTWLSRSGVLPLSISLLHSASTANPVFENQVLSSVIVYASRWRHIALLVSPISFPLVSAISKETLPLLETFSFHDITIPQPTHSEYPSWDGFLAPGLRSLSSSHPSFIPRELDWAQLTSLSIESQDYAVEGLTPMKALDILEKCQNLINCRLEFGRDATFSPGDYPTVTVPLLQTLVIREGHATIQPFFALLRLPSLKQLEFSSSPSGFNLAELNIRDSSLRSLLSQLDGLQELSLSAYNMSRNTLLEYLTCVPSITRLSILIPPTPRSWSNRGWQDFNPGGLWRACDDEVFTHLTPTEGQHPVCPCLRIVECNPCDVSDAMLLKFIQQRTTHAESHGVERLERVDVSLRRQMEMDVVAALPPSVLGGTEVRLQYYETWPRRWNHAPWTGLDKPGRLELVRKPWAFLRV